MNFEIGILNHEVFDFSQLFHSCENRHRYMMLKTMFQQNKMRNEKINDFKKILYLF